MTIMVVVAVCPNSITAAATTTFTTTTTTNIGTTGVNVVIVIVVVVVIVIIIITITLVLLLRVLATRATVLLWTMSYLFAVDATMTPSHNDTFAVAGTDLGVVSNMIMIMLILVLMSIAALVALVTTTGALVTRRNSFIALLCYLFCCT